MIRTFASKLGCGYCDVFLRVIINRLRACAFSPDDTGEMSAKCLSNPDRVTGLFITQPCRDHHTRPSDLWHSQPDTLLQRYWPPPPFDSHQSRSLGVCLSVCVCVSVDIEAENDCVRKLKFECCYFKLKVQYTTFSITRSRLLVT